MSISKIIKIQKEIQEIMNQDNPDFNIFIDKVNSKLRGIYSYYAVETNDENITEIYRYVVEKAFKRFRNHTVSTGIKARDRLTAFNWYYPIVEPSIFSLC